VIADRPHQRELDLPENAKLLVVDDDPTALRLVEAMLGELGGSLQYQPSAEAALEFASRQAPDIVVLDLLLPGISGLEFIDRFRELPGCSRVPIVVWTVKDLNNQERERLRRTTSAFVAKGSGDGGALLNELRRFFRPSPGGLARVR
jgi:CheY-like chemotaxis protein